MTRRLSRLSVSVILALALFGCGDDDDGSQSPDPLVAGPYPVGVTTIELFDEAQGRNLVTEVWYPAAESAREEEAAPLETYLPAGFEGVAANSTVPLVAVRDAEISPQAPFPLIAFSHGNGAVRFQNTFQCEHLASHGFVVIAPDHEGNTFFPSEWEGNIVDARPLDVLFLMDSFESFDVDPGSRFFGWIDTTPGYGVTGHSFGAFTSIRVANMDERITAVLPMAFGGPLEEGYDAPTFLMLGTEDKTIGVDGNEFIAETYEALPGPRFLAEVVDAGHYSFTFACQVGFAGPWDPDGCEDNVRFADGSPFEFVDDMRVWDIIDGYSAAFFGRYIKGIDSYDDVLTTNIDPEVVLYTAEP